MKSILRLSSLLGWQDVKQAYRRSVIGPFWITGAMAVQIGTIVLIFGTLFKSPVVDYLPFVTVGIIFWSFISSALNDGCNSFIMSEGIIRQIKLPFITYTLRALFKNVITLGHNLIILPIAFLIVLKSPSYSTILLLPGMVLLLANVSWMMLLLAMVSARYRDLPPLVSASLIVLLNLTPVFWYPTALGNATLSHFLLGLNPFYHLIQVVRLPLLGQFPTVENWVYLGLLSLVGWASALVMLRALSKRIAYWV